LFDTPTTLSQIGVDAANGVAQPVGHPANNATSSVFALSALLQTTPLIGSNGSCPSDVMVGGRVLAFSQMCPSLNILGAALQAFAYLIATFIVFRDRK